MAKKILILYSEVMPYMAAVWDVLASKYGCQISVVHWDKKKLTPYVFSNSIITVFDRSTENVF